jgi:prolyl oligopeptidase
VTPAPAYPPTRRDPVVEELHGVRVPDPYRWLEDTESDDTAAWVRAQNEVTFRYLASLPQREPLRRRARALWDHERFSLPFSEGGRTFYFRNDGLQNQAVLQVVDHPGAEPRVLLDPNTLSADGTVALTVAEASPDGRLLAWGSSSGGSDWQEFRVRDVETGQDLPDRLQWVKFSGVAWTEDSRGFFYSRYPEPTGGRLLEANRDMRLHYHRLGTPQAEDPLVCERPDHPEWGFSARVSDDGRWLLVAVWHGTDPRNRLFVKPLGNPLDPEVTGPLTELVPEPVAMMQPVEVVGDSLLVLTDLDAPRRRLVVAPLARGEAVPGDPAAWPTLIPQDEAVLESAQLLGGRLVLQRLRDARGEVRIHALDGALLRTLELPGPGTVAGISGQADHPEIHYAFTSFLHPTTILRHHLESGATGVFRAPRVDFDPAPFVTRQDFVVSSDGTRVPVFVTHRADAPRDGTNRVLMYGYGGFGVALTPFFSVANALWLERGGVLAVACLRGGGEYGDDWHRAGTLERKQNVFDDAIAVAEHLVREGWTRPGGIGIQGGSNGGLLVGAVVNQRPELFGVALPAVGVMDMLRFHRFTIGWAWASDYGTADDPEIFPHLLAYSPLHNLREGTCYPATLITTADHDDRVVPGHSFKYAAALQAAQGCHRPVLIRIETRAGHGAGKPTDKLIEEAADVLAFAEANLGRV